MNNVQNEINRQLLSILKDVDGKIENVHAKVELLNKVAQVFSVVNR